MKYALLVVSLIAILVLLASTVFILFSFEYLEPFNYLQVIAFAVLAIGFIVAFGVWAVVGEIEGLRKDLADARRPSSKVGSKAWTR